MSTTAQHPDEPQNFWPGYVDTLVNMVMFLILLIVILSMAVMFFSVKARNDALTHNKSPVPMQTPGKMANETAYPGGTSDKLPKNPTMADMRKLVESLKEKLHQSELRFKQTGQNPQVLPNMTKSGKSSKQEETLATASASPGTLPSGVQDIALRPGVLVIRFRAGALDMTDAEAKRMSVVFAKHFDYAQGSNQDFALTVDAAEGLSESNRMAFYRVASVRNRLMGVAGVPASKIAQRINAVPANAVTGSEALEVRITKVE